MTKTQYDALLGLPSPAYVVVEDLLRQNLEVLRGIRERTGCKILLAQKAFSMFSVYPLIAAYLDGTTASGLYEARLGFEEMPGKQVHVYKPAFTEAEFPALLEYCDHIVFNSLSQWEKFRGQVQRAPRPISCGMRINPEYAEVEQEIYNPCAAGSRLGVTADKLDLRECPELEGLHFHTMCEQGADVLQRTLERVEQKFGSCLTKMKWLNCGGGHHITRPGYDITLLETCIKRMQDKYHLEIYLEPGEAVALNAGYLVCRVIDLVHNGMDIAILDTSAACHMPDVLEMPYRPQVIGAGQPREKEYTYRFAGPTCLAGDIIGDYSLDAPLSPGDMLVFCDMAIYSMCKNNTFNGMPLPAIALYSAQHGVKLLREFDYADFKGRLS